MLYKTVVQQCLIFIIHDFHELLLNKLHDHHQSDGRQKICLVLTEWNEVIASVDEKIVVQLKEKSRPRTTSFHEMAN